MDDIQINGNKNAQNNQINEKAELDQYFASKYDIYNMIYLKSNIYRQTVHINQNEENEGVVKTYSLKYINSETLDKYVCLYFIYYFRI